MQKLEGFTYKEGNIAGDDVWLVTPDDITTKWTQDTLHLRSVIVRQSDGKIISSGFKKFFNFPEKPDLDPWNPDWKVQATGKKDGSLLIVSKYKDELIVRTRGTFSAKQLDNGHEIDGLIEKYPAIFNSILLDCDCSILFEWTTPNNVIVLRESDEPKLWLIGIIMHSNGQYLIQDTLDEVAKNWDVDRPKRHYYNSLAECMDDVAMWKDQEGVVLHSEDGQVLKKVKAEHYLALHQLKSSISSISKLIETYLTIDDRPDYDGFYKFIESTMDFELAEACKDNMRKITDANVIIMQEIAEATIFAQGLDGLSRKDQAGLICKKYPDWRKGFCFAVLDGKENYLDNSKLLDIFKSKIV